MVDGTRVLALERRVSAVRRIRQVLAGTEQMVQRLVVLAAGAVAAPMAAASLITDEQQVLVGVHGLPPELGTGVEVPVVDAVCRWVVTAGAPLIVGDVSADRRFADTIAVRTLAGAAYAGFPVLDGDGEVLGVLAVLDRRPRVWSREDLATLGAAAQLCGDMLGYATTAQAVTVSETGRALGMDGVAGSVMARRSEAFLAALLDSLDTGVAACSRDGRLVLFNRAARQIVGGAEPNDSPPQLWADRFGITHPDGRPFTVDEMPLMRALQGGAVHNVDLVIPDGQGRRRRYAANANPIIDRAGEKLGAVSAFRDVTDERRALRFRRCEASVADALNRTADADSAAEAVLAAIAPALAWPYAELWLHDPASDTFRPAARWHRPGAAGPLPVPDRMPAGAGLPGLAWTHQQPVSVEDFTALPSARAGLAEAATRTGLRAAVAAPIRSGTDVYGTLIGFTTTVEDINDALTVMLAGLAAQLGQHLQRRRAEDLAHQLTRAKDDYIRLVSHELRTPLTSIAAYTDLLASLGECLPEDGQQMLAAISRNSDALRRLVDSLLDLAALDSGHATIRYTRTDLTSIVRDVVDTARLTADDWQLSIALDLPEVLPIDGDPTRLGQVITILVGNAIAYSHPGGRISIALRPVGDHAELAITDAGIGIPTHELEAVFERFHRSSRARDLSIPGTGLGLPTARLIIEHHHGNLTLNIAPTGGITATVALPRRQPAQATSVGQPS